MRGNAATPFPDGGGLLASLSRSCAKFPSLRAAQSLPDRATAWYQASSTSPHPQYAGLTARVLKQSAPDPSFPSGATEAILPDGIGRAMSFSDVVSALPIARTPGTPGASAATVSTYQPRGSARGAISQIWGILCDLRSHHSEADYSSTLPEDFLFAGSAPTPLSLGGTAN